MPSHSNIDKDLNIYPLNIDTSKLNEIDCYPLCDIPFFIICCGRVRAGKSLLLNNLSLDERKLYGPHFDVKIFISPCSVNDPMNQYICEEFDYVFTEYSDTLLEKILEMIEEDETDNRYLLILDDIIGVMTQKRTGNLDAMTNLVTRYRHTGNSNQEGKLSVIISTQYWKYVTGIIRTNSTGYYLMGNFPESELKKMSEDLSYFGGDNKVFLDLWKKAREKDKKEKKDTKGKNYNFLFLNVKKGEARKNHNVILWDEENGIYENTED